MSNSSLAAHSQAGKEEDAVNDITYVGKLTMNYSVARHAHESWEFVYCTYGSGTFSFDSGTLEYQEGDVVIIPPMVPHSNGSEDGFQNIHINMVSPSLSYASPRVVSDDSNHFLLDAFSAAYFQFYSDRKEAAALLSLYGDLISCYLAAYRTGVTLTPIVAQIENNIIANYADSKYELDAYMQSLPFSYDYLRKLFQKEIGVTPHRYLIDKRLKMAAELLVTDDSAGARTITDIAYLCGFRDSLYFSKMFRKKYGISPRNYPKAERNKTAPVPDAESPRIMM